MNSTLLETSRPAAQAPAKVPAPYRFPWYAIAAGGVVAAVLLTAALYTPIAYGERLLALLMLPQALFTSGVAGVWIALVVGDPPVKE